MVLVAIGTASVKNQNLLNRRVHIDIQRLGGSSSGGQRGGVVTSM